LFENYFCWYPSQPLACAAAAGTTASASGEQSGSLVPFDPACVIVPVDKHHPVLTVDADVNNRHISKCTAAFRSTKTHGHCCRNSAGWSWSSWNCCRGERTRTGRHPDQHHHTHVFLL
jgi:hypothetical protein